ncbi:uncharacterized protein PV09_05891 [Verruconis gallopava]|uniref:Ureidoglycolate hydrolase n=1 Tax=Verruconis gallopava TaxID=253628 RepID=A0A0D2AUK6_9PEZI|nr:uncharacterized protein PV09_05891 [Verruconis gallopava]KIW02834.1 hypothetical protein PV09_05891 [Verruconis gallopava]
MTAWPKPVSAAAVEVKIERLDGDAFAPFGTVIQNPARAERRASSTLRLNVVEANQGSALKYVDVSHLTNHYGSAPSGRPARPVVNMFVCKPRPLRARRWPGAGEADHVFDVRVLERHPFTPQTFVPVGLAAADPKTKYLVVVAPTLPDVQQAATGVASGLRKPRPARPSHPTTQLSDAEALAPKPKGQGLPDLSKLRAFLADGSQAVTYGPGTWHAPMVVLGEEPVDFVVVQFANGVGDEDCQEVLLQSEGGKGVEVVVEMTPDSPQLVRSKL